MREGLSMNAPDAGFRGWARWRALLTLVITPDRGAGADFGVPTYFHIRRVGRAERMDGCWETAGFIAAITDRKTEDAKRDDAGAGS